MHGRRRVQQITASEHDAVAVVGTHLLNDWTGRALTVEDEVRLGVRLASVGNVEHNGAALAAFKSYPAWACLIQGGVRSSLVVHSGTELWKVVKSLVSESFRFLFNLIVLGDVEEFFNLTRRFHNH